MTAIAWRELRRAWSSGGVLLPVAFFLLVTILFPFAVGPDAKLLSRIAGGVVWAAALLAALMPVERLVGPDMEAGVLDQFTARPLRECCSASPSARPALPRWRSRQPH